MLLADWLKLLVTETLPAPESVPPLMLREFIVDAPPRLRVPAEMLTWPVVPPFSAPLRVALPVPETVNPPPSVVMPETDKEPPETLRELLPLMVSAAMLSVPVACVTA